MDISLIVNSDEDPAKLAFKVELESWTENGMNMTISFANPLLLS